MLLTAAAYVLMQELRLRAARTKLARAQVSTLRDAFLKIGTRVSSASVRRIVLQMPGASLTWGLRGAARPVSLPPRVPRPERRPRPARRSSRACRGRRSSRRRSDGWNAYLRRVRGQTVVITHPGHPLRGRTVAVLHYRPKGRSPSVLVEMPDQTAQALPLSWTDRASPDPHRMAIGPGTRLSGLALVELVRLMESWERDS